MTPPGISEAVFADFLSEMRSALGAEWVFTEEEDLHTYRDFYSVFWGEPEERRASAAVAPASVEQVQAVVRAANERAIPIYPISTGRNLGYGGAAPVLSGSVVIDLKRMNRVLEVDEGNCSCLVEPGVSYFDMYRHLRESGSKLWLDVPAPGWGSLLGNALDSGGGYTAAGYRGHWEAVAGIEAVMADGEVLRTGMGALPGSETWQQYRMGIGPVLDGLFRQSSLGVVTKMGFWLFPQPESFLAASVEVPWFEDLGPLVELVNELEYGNLFNGMPSIGSPVLQGRNPALWEIVPSPDEMNRRVRESGRKAWRATFNFYGPEAVVRMQWEHIRDRFNETISGATFTEDDFLRLPLTDADLARVFEARFGIPTLDRFSLGSRGASPLNPSEGHIWISAVIPRTAEGIINGTRTMVAACERLGIPVLAFSPSITCWTRSLVMFAAVPVYKDERNARLRASVEELIDIFTENGWGEYRCPPAFMDKVMSAYSFNDHILRRVNERIKDALDPKGIISAGRYGIWPRHLREGRQA
jgi:4-cresol dehydrogenase (hydroxylating)